MLIQPVIFPAALFVALSNLEKIWLTCVFFYATIPLAVGKPRSDAGIAQSVEQLIRNQQVVCSSHIASSNTKAPCLTRGFFFFRIVDIFRFAHAFRLETIVFVCYKAAIRRGGTEDR